jgi:membrane fusion protein, multidrug efflux system
MPGAPRASPKVRPNMSRIAQRFFAALGTWHWALVIIACLAVAYAAWHELTLAPTGAGAPTPPEVPVHVGTAEKKSFPVVLNGLGTVQPTNVVTVRSRVDGQIEKVAFKEGQMVKQGDLLVQIDPAPFKAALDQATAKLAQDQASLTNAKQDLARTSTLARQGDATLQLLDQRTANVASLNALVLADQAAIESANVQLAYTTIRSPLTGRTGFRLIDPGNIVHAADQNGMLTITQLQPITVVFTAPEQDLPAINEALHAGPLKVTAYSSDGKRALANGTLRLVDNQVDVASGTIHLKASFDNADHALWPGLSVSTKLVVSTVPDAVVVADNAVQRGPNGLYVYVVTPDSKAELRSVSVGPIDGGQALIEKGVSPGERVVTSGQYKVVPGEPVQVLQEQRTAETPAAGKVE